MGDYQQWPAKQLITSSSSCLNLAMACGVIWPCSAAVLDRWQWTWFCCHSLAMILAHAAATYLSHTTGTSSLHFVGPQAQQQIRQCNSGASTTNSPSKYSPQSLLLICCGVFAALTVTWAFLHTMTPWQCCMGSAKSASSHDNPEQ